MKFKEIVIIEEMLRNLAPTKCLEWGSGYSTLYFPRFLRKGAEWVSIEHEEVWYSEIRRANRNPQVKLYHISPNSSTWKGAYGTGRCSNLKEYVDFPSRFGKFDFILIDGLARKDCLVKTRNLLENHGIAILHDANRKHYREPLRLFKHQVLFEDHQEDAGGLWVGAKKRNVNTMLHVDKYKRFWLAYTKLEKWLTPEEIRVWLIKKVLKK